MKIEIRIADQDFSCLLSASAAVDAFINKMNFANKEVLFILLVAVDTKHRNKIIQRVKIRREKNLKNYKVSFQNNKD